MPTLLSRSALRSMTHQLAMANPAVMISVITVYGTYPHWFTFQTMSTWAIGYPKIYIP